MDAVLGWNLVLSLPVILAVAWLAGRPPGGVAILGGHAGGRRRRVAGRAGPVAGHRPGGGGRARVHPQPLAVLDLLHHVRHRSGSSYWPSPAPWPGPSRAWPRSPDPLRAVRRSSRRLSRYVQITRIAVQHGFGPLLGLGQPTGDEVAPPRRAHRPPGACARRSRSAPAACSSKLGQVLSARADLLPAGVVAELSRLQDHVAAGRTPDAGPGACRRSSLGAGQLAEGVRRVRVREPDRPAGLDRPGLPGPGFRLEARNATEIAALTDNDQICVPDVHTELSTARILVMEWLDGVSVRETGADRRASASTARGSPDAAAVSLSQMLVDGHFHADPHPGNVHGPGATAGSGSSTSAPPGGSTPCSSRRCGR